MDSRKKEIILLVSLVFIFLIINYSFLDKSLEEFLSTDEYVNVTRIIDGDTIEVNENISVRLLGINSPERGEEYYNEAKEFLENKILKKKVKLKFGKNKFDKYKRILAYVYFENKNINLDLVENGFANYYFPSGKDIFYNDFVNSWGSCIDKEINLCEKSREKCSNCILLKEFDYKNDRIIFYNKCSFDCELTSWKIKDEGRKNFIFPEFVLGSYGEVEVIVGDEEDSEGILFWKNEDYVFTKSGDSLFLRDSEGKLVLWEKY